MLLVCACVSEDDTTAVYQLQGHPSQAVTVHEKEELQKPLFRCCTTISWVQAAWPSASAHERLAEMGFQVFYSSCMTSAKNGLSFSIFKKGADFNHQIRMLGSLLLQVKNVMSFKAGVKQKQKFVTKST